MKKRIIIIFIMVMFIILLNAITEKQLIEMQNAGQLIVGKGVAKTEEEADKLALQNLASQIVVNIKSSFINIAREENSKVDEYCESVVKTFSNVQLNDARKYILSKTNDKKCVYRYITPQEKDKIFEDRKAEILSFVSDGEIAEEENNVADAMRNYYWGLMLLKTHPDYRRMEYTFDNHQNLLYVSLINKIEKLLSQIDIKITSIKDTKDSNCYDIVLLASYNNIPADGLRVKYYDGFSWSNYEKWSNGIGYFSIQKSMAKTMDFIKMKIDYAFLDLGFEGDIKQTLKQMKPYKFDNAIKKCIFKKDNAAQKENPVSMVLYEKNLSKEKIAILKDVISSISKKNLFKSRKYFTTKGFRDFNSLIGYGDAQILPIKFTLKNVQLGKLSIVRSVPMKFNFSQSKEEFTERVNFIFNENNKIEGITFALSDRAIKDIVTKNYASDYEKATIINFIEQYKTAYCLKDLDFIKKIFDKDALIIVGRVIKTKPDEMTDKLYQQLGDDTIEYIKLNKEKYIKRLKKQFAKKKFINIRFTDNKIDRIVSKGKNVFGIQIAQYYYSSDYSDKGYLFLMFDMKNPKEPKIMIRSWQPKKRADGTIVGVNDFQFE